MDDKDVFNRIFNKLDSQEERLNTTCNTIARIDQKITDFIEAVNKRDAIIKQDVENRYKKITAVFGTITSVSVLIGIAKVFGVI